MRNYTRREFGAKQAKAYMARIRQGFKTLRSHPEIGYQIDDLKPGYRCFQIEYHRLSYRLDGDVIAVIAVLHESQLPKRHLSQRKED